MSIELKGMDQLQKKLMELAKLSKEAMEEELEDIALDLAGKCSEAAPVESGDLRGDLAEPRKDGEGWEIGSSLVYTRYQHEGTWFKHPKGGGAKFIEKPFRQNKNKYIKEIERAIESRLK